MPANFITGGSDDSALTKMLTADNAKLQRLSAQRTQLEAGIVSALKPPQSAREYRFGRYEITRFPRQGRWTASAGPMTGAAGYRTLIGAVLAARRVARSEAS